MKLPLSWLKDYVDIDVSIEELQKKLFSCGFEVEEVIRFAENVDKIVVAKILKIEQHPNADKLLVTQIDAGKYGKLQIITAAHNIFEGALVPVALDGSTLFNGEHIYNGELRGLPSFGMFCSGEELGITDDYYDGASVHGILILKEDYPLGAEVKEVLGIEDVIFDINVTANRPDCQSILGLAREVAAVLNKPLKMPDLTYKTCEDIKTTTEIKVENKAFDLCPRYMAQYVSDIKIEKSPKWMTRRLASVGLRSINNIVDITNFVLMEIGQPMHAFDRKDLLDSSIIVRRATDGEEITTLDEKTFKLNKNNLVICDKTKPVALAGVMGGLNSGIKDDTTEIVFEAAKFKRDNIRKTARALGQSSDSSSRFEKGIDAYTTEIGLNRALNLIDTLNCGKISSDRYDLMEEKLEEKVINTTISKINSVLGIVVPTKDIEEILTKLNFKVEINGDDIKIIVPLYREDVDDYPDIAEEIIREYGYDHIGSTLLETSKVTLGGKNKEQVRTDNIKNLLCGYGFNEIITYSFVSKKDYAVYGLDENKEEYKYVEIINPLSEDVNIMRTTLIPSMVQVVINNINRKNNEGKLFELAKVYNTKALPVTELPIERERLALGMFGNVTFFDLKGVVEGFIETFVGEKDVVYKRSELSYMHQTRSADVFVEGVKVGYFGELSPKVSEKCGTDKRIYVAELYLDQLKDLYDDKVIFKQVSKFPSIERDLALIVDDEVLCQDVVNVIKKNGGEYLESVSLFDIYKGNQIAENKKSLAFNLVFVSNERTLNVEEIDEIIDKTLKELKTTINAELR